MANSPHPWGAAGRGEAQSRMTRPKILPPLLRLTSVPIRTTGWPEGSASMPPPAEAALSSTEDPGRKLSHRRESPEKGPEWRDQRPASPLPLRTKSVRHFGHRTVLGNLASSFTDPN